VSDLVEDGHIAIAARLEGVRGPAISIEAARPVARRFGSPPTFSPVAMRRFADMRASARRNPRELDRIVMGHVAFTKAGGFVGSR
jgi:hypothetical protein